MRNYLSLITWYWQQGNAICYNAYWRMNISHFLIETQEHMKRFNNTRNYLHKSLL